MRSASRIWTGPFAVALVACSAGAAVAETGTYALSWVREAGAEACGDESAFAEEVERRLGTRPFDPASSRKLTVRMRRVPTGFRSEIDATSESGAGTGARVLGSADEDCLPLFNATALAVALALDPEAVTRMDANAPRAVAAFEGVPEARPPQQPKAPLVVTVQVPVPVPAAPGPAPGGFSVRTDLAARALLAAGILPAAGPGFELSASHRFDDLWGIALGGSYLAPTRTSASGGAVFGVGLTAFGAAATLDFARGKALRCSIFGGALAGALHVTVETPRPTSQGDFFFAAFRTGVRAQAAVSEEFFLELGAAAVAPFFYRGLFVDGDRAAVFRQHLAGGLGWLGAAVPFP